MKTVTTMLLVILTCAGCREEAKKLDRAQPDPPFNRKSDERVTAIEQEMSNMPQKLVGKGLDAKLWGCNLTKGIIEIENPSERVRLMNRCLDSLAQLEPSLKDQHNIIQAFHNYEELIGTCTIFEDEPEIAERILEIMRDCIRLHRQEVEKWSDAINNEPNRRNRVPLKNIYRGLESDFMVFTNRVERTYFPWMKSHGLPPDRHELWRQRINDAEGRQ